VKVAKYFHVMWICITNGMARVRVADVEDGPHIWRVAMNILKKQLRTAERRWSSSLGVGRLLITVEKSCYTKYYTRHRTWILWNDLGNGKSVWDLEHGMLRISVRQVH